MEDGHGNVGDAGPLKRVLIIAYYWPPAGGPGVQRWLKFSKYLPEFGWSPTVLVPDGAAYPILDPSLEQDIPDGLKVIRVPIWEPYEAAMALLQGKKGAERLGSISSTASSKPSLGRTLMLWCRGNLLLPDPRILWRRKARRTALSLWGEAAQSDAPFDALVTTGPPHSIHLIGLDLKRKVGMPWLADFRDLWREMDYLRDFHPTARTSRRHAHMERAVFQSADSVTYPSPGVGLSLASDGTPESRSKLELIYNGWDPSDVPQTDLDVHPRHDDHAFHVGHFGSLFPTRDAPGLWAAIQEWNQQADRKPIHLHVVGKINPNVRTSIQSVLSDQEWTDHGYVSHSEAIAHMRRMDGLLLIQNDNDTGQRAIPGKAFEYLATGRPMAIVAPIPSDLDELAREWGLSPTGHHDARGAMAMLEGLFQQSGDRREHIDRFSRRHLTASIARCLDGISSPTDPS